MKRILLGLILALSSCSAEAEEAKYNPYYKAYLGCGNFNVIAEQAYKVPLKKCGINNYQVITSKTYRSMCNGGETITMVYKCNKSVEDK